MSDGLVSVIIPTYNRAHCIGRAIDSVLAQTYGEVDVIVIDDGSKDDTRARVLDTYGKDSRVRYVHQDNCGVSAARNHGIRQVKGELAALLDSDDAWMPDKLALQLACLRAFTDAGMVWSDMTAIGPGGEVREERHLRTFYGAYKWFSSDDLFDRSVPLAEIAPGLAPLVGHHRAYSGEIYAKMCLGNLVHTSTVLMRRERLAASGFFDESRRSGEDHEFHLHTCRAGRVAFADVPTILYQVGNADQLTESHYGVEMARNFLATLTTALDRDRDRIHLPQRLIDEALAEAHGWLGEGLLREGSLREAQRHLFRSLRANPRQPRLIRLYVASFLPEPVRRLGKELYSRVRSAR